MKTVMQTFDIDLVYLWVDGNDPDWIKKKHQATGIVADNSEENNRGRYISNNELKYSLRSVEKNIPWIHKIYIVTDNQRPDWLNIDHPLIQIIDHTEILPKEALPCFNSSVIEYFIYKIPNLKEHFLLANDDVFFNKKVSPDYFFNSIGLPFVRLKKKLFGRWHYDIKRLRGRRLGQYISKVIDGAKLVEKHFGVYYSSIPHHNVDSYIKSDYRYAVEHLFSSQVELSLGNKIRKYGDLHRSAFLYYALAVGRGELKHVGRRESSRINVSKQNWSSYLNRYSPDLFCLNDSQRSNDNDRERVEPFLASLFPLKSAFEK